MKRILIYILPLLPFFAAMSQETRLPGSSLDVAHAVSNTESVFLGRFIKTGRPTIGSLGASEYIDADLEIVKVLTGQAVEAGRYKARYRVFNEPPESAESIPQVGVEYVLCGRAGGSLISVTKIAKATAQNIQQAESSAATVGGFDEEGHVKQRVRVTTNKAETPALGRRDDATAEPQGHHLLSGFLIGATIIGLGGISFMWIARKRARR
jgi:hypothetical protein